MASPASNSPLRGILGQTAYTTSKGKEITYEDLAKCTGKSQTITARVLSRLDIFSKGGGIVTDARVKKILKENGVTKLNDISNQFKQEAKNISQKAAHESYTAKELKQDSKELNRAEDLIKLFEKFKDENQEKILNKYSDKNFIEKAHDKAENKKSRKEFTELRELKEINDAKLILSTKAALNKYSPVDLLKAAIWEKETNQTAEQKGQLSHDFHQFLNKQVPYPTTESELKATYQNFINETLNKAENFQKSGPYDRDANAHKAKMEEYVKPKTDPLAQFITVNSINASLGLVGPGSVLAKELENMRDKELLERAKLK